MKLEGSFPHWQESATSLCPALKISLSLRPCEMFRNMISFYGEDLLAPNPTPKLEDYPLSAVRDCLFNIFAATLHIWMLFLHPQPEDAPCCSDKDPLIMKAVFYIFQNHFLCPEYSHRFSHYGCVWNGHNMLSDTCTVLPLLWACLSTPLPPSSE